MEPVISMNALTHSISIYVSNMIKIYNVLSKLFINTSLNFAYSWNYCTWVTLNYRNIYICLNITPARTNAHQVKMITTFKETTPSPTLEEVYSRKDNIYNISFLPIVHEYRYIAHNFRPTQPYYSQNHSLIVWLYCQDSRSHTLLWSHNKRAQLVILFSRTKMQMPSKWWTWLNLDQGHD